MFFFLLILSIIYYHYLLLFLSKGKWNQITNIECNEIRNFVCELKGIKEIFKKKTEKSISTFKFNAFTNFLPTPPPNTNR